MKTLNKIIQNPLLIVVIMIKDLKDLLLDVKMILLDTNITTIQSFDWWDFIIKLIIAIALWLVLKSYFKLKRDYEIQNILFSIRNRYNFIQSFQDIEFLRLPDETDESFFNRLPEKQYKEYLKAEYSKLKQIIMKKYDIKPSEAQVKLDKIYGIKRKKK